jgi:hypothetical protein
MSLTRKKEEDGQLRKMSDLSFRGEPLFFAVSKDGNSPSI